MKRIVISNATGGERTVLASVAFVPAPEVEAGEVLVVRPTVVPRSGRAPVIVAASVVPQSGMLSVEITFDDELAFSGGCKWGDAAHGCLLRLSDGSYVEVHLLDGA